MACFYFLLDSVSNTVEGVGAKFKFVRKVLWVGDVDIQAQIHKAYDEKAQTHKAKKKIQDLIQDLGGAMTRGRLRKTQDAFSVQGDLCAKGSTIKGQSYERD